MRHGVWVIALLVCALWAPRGEARFALHASINARGVDVASRDADDPLMPVPLREPRDVLVLDSVAVQFLGDSLGEPTAPDANGQSIHDRGREVQRDLILPIVLTPHRVIALVSIDPIAKSDREVWDRYDRAGNLRLVVPGAPDLELARFMTAYGGHTEFRFDLTPYASLLHGKVALRAFIDTWSSPAWAISVILRYEPAPALDAAAWAAPVYSAPSFDATHMPRGDSAVVVVPARMRRVVLRYLSTGHCTDGRDADEFISKANVIRVDGHVVVRVHPWRTDCRDFRERNPYCTRWTDGSWSCDYSRSGWCPGTEVVPMEFDLTDYLTPGRHTVSIAIEDMRPRGEDGAYGYWRVSAACVGWDHVPALWRNEE